jgi:hypothetical protein
VIAVYIAAPFASAQRARDLHRRLEGRGMRWTSLWAEAADGPEDLDAMHVQVRENVRATNHDAIRASGALLVLGTGAPCETLVELGIAIAHGLPVVWLEGEARLPLSATCASVCTRVASIEAALDELGRLAPARRAP